MLHARLESSCILLDPKKAQFITRHPRPRQHGSGGVGREHIAAYKASAVLTVGPAVDLHAKLWQTICCTGW